MKPVIDYIYVCYRDVFDHCSVGVHIKVVEEDNSYGFRYEFIHKKSDYEMFVGNRNNYAWFNNHFKPIGMYQHKISQFYF